MKEVVLGYMARHIEEVTGSDGYKGLQGGKKCL
jgi:hypothetical protein